MSVFVRNAMSQLYHLNVRFVKVYSSFRFVVLTAKTVVRAASLTYNRVCRPSRKPSLSFPKIPYFPQSY